MVLPLAAALEAGKFRDAVLAVDPETPYRVLTEVLFTLGQAHVSGFHFLATYGTRPALALGSVDVYPPARGSDGFPVGQSSTPIEVRLLPQSMVVRGGGTNAPAGCDQTASADGETQYDYVALTRCGAAMKKADGLTGDLVLVASQEVAFHVIVSTMDALAPDYPKVTFGVMR